MNFPVIYKKQALFGLDIGQHTAKFLQLKQAGKKYGLVGLGSVTLEDSMVIEGVIAEPERLAKKITEALKQPELGKINAHSVAAGLPQAYLFSRIINLPAMPTDKLAEAVQWEAQQYIPMPMTDIYLDFEIVTTLKNDRGEIREYEILLVAAPRAIIDSYMKLFEFMQLTPHSLETTLAANIRALHPNGSEDAAVVVIDSGSTATDMAIVTNVVRVTTTIAFGGDALTYDLTQHLKIAEAHAIEIKSKFGIASSGLQTKIMAAVHPRLNTLISEVQKLIKYYHERGQTEKTQNIQRILLTGGVSRMPGFAEYLSAQTKLPVDISSPWDHQPVAKSQPLPHTTATTYTTAFGLALREFVE